MFWSKRKSKEEDISSPQQSIVVGISSTPCISNNSTTEDVEARIEAKLLKQMKKEMSRYEKDAITKAEIIFSEKYNALERSVNDKLRQAQLYQNDNDISIASEYPNNMSTRRMINHDSQRNENKNQDLCVVEDGTIHASTATDASYQDLFDDNTHNEQHGVGGETTPYSTTNNHSKDHDEIVEVPLPQDSYSIMMTSNPFSFPWLFAFIVFLLQALLFAVVLVAQFQGLVGSAHSNIPVKLQLYVLIGQALAILVVFAIQDDIIDSIKIGTIFLSLYEARDRMLNSINLKRIVQEEDGQLNHIDYSANAKAYWNMNTMRILVPCILKLLVGLLGMVASFFIVVTSEDTISLFKDFAALGMISFVDDIAFKLCADGMFGTLFVKKTEEVQRIMLKRQRLKKRKVPLQTIFLAAVIVGVFTAWVVIVTAQQRGIFFHKKYPGCLNKDHKNESFLRLDVEDNVCDGWANNMKCGFDGGDCINFNIAFPNCKAERPREVGDGICQDMLVTKECGYDQGDCCKIGLEKKFGWSMTDAQFLKDFKPEVGNGICNQTFNIPECQYDNKDCDVVGYPDCHVNSPGAKHTFVGNGICDEIFDTKECGFDGGDCLDLKNFPECKVRNAKELLSNKKCDIELAIPECMFDNGFCNIFDETSDVEKKRNEYPDCRVSNNSIVSVGNGICEGGELNVESCKFDGGDCVGFNENFTFPCGYNNASFDAYMNTCEDSFSYQLLGKAIPGKNAKDKAGASVDLSADGLTMAIGSRNHNGNAGNVRVFSFSHADGAWKQLGNDIDGLEPEDLSGEVSVSDDGSIIAVGARGDGARHGYVRIFSLYVNGTETYWEQMGPRINGTQSGDKFGLTLDLGSDGKTIAIGSPYHDGPYGSDSGMARVYVFDETDNNWIQKGNDFHGSEEYIEMTYNNGLALNGDGSIIALGSYKSSNGGKYSTGKVSVYHYDKFRGNWKLEVMFIGQESNDKFGQALDLSHDGHTLAVANIGQNQVHVYSFDKPNSKWQKTGTINVLDSDFFITKLALSSSGNSLIAGSQRNNGEAGRIKVYVYYENEKQTAWAEVEDLSGATVDEFASDVAISESGCIIASGARKSNTAGHLSGSAKVFSKCQ